jgi:hypothetical protein
MSRWVGCNLQFALFDQAVLGDSELGRTFAVIVTVCNAVRSDNESALISSVNEGIKRRWFVTLSDIASISFVNRVIALHFFYVQDVDDSC